SLAYNFFLLPPLYTFTIGDPDNVLAFFAFIIVALIISQLTSRTRAQTLAAREQAATTAALLNFSRRLAGTRKLEQLYDTAAQEVAQLLKVECVVLAPAGEELKLVAAVPATTKIEEADIAAATWCWRKTQPTGWGSDTLPGAHRLYVPMTGGTATLGVIGVSRIEKFSGSAPLHAHERRLLDALADLTVIALDRILLARDVDQSKMLAQTEKLRSALLTSISHDLRTPLSSILGAISSLRAYGKKYDEKARDELLTTAQDETERMSRFVANLLDMTRLDSGALAPKAEACDLNDVAGAALRRAEKLLAKHQVQIDIPGNVPMVKLDFVLLEQVLVNLLDNAAKYSPAGSTVELAVNAHRYAVTLEVRDRGPGIPPEDLQRIFDPFFRVRQGDQQRAGTGLGLAVCRGFVQAMNARISASNRAGGGAVFTIEFPASLLVRADGVPA
ncbi:MAG TPA: ATP-binding protein, partial [Nevskiaceae bacterium]|nr:ATP-binding protein [Nevskiaceae bacterium]